VGRTPTDHSPAARPHVSNIKIMEINGYRSLTDALNGTHQTAALGACNKMFWSESHQRTMELAMDILGMDAQILQGSAESVEVLPGLRRGRSDYPVDELQAAFFFSRSETIWAGPPRSSATSSASGSSAPEGAKGRGQAGLTRPVRVGRRYPAMTSFLPFFNPATGEWIEYLALTDDADGAWCVSTAQRAGA